MDSPEPPQLPYTPEESFAAHDEWKASCGHHSLASACAVPLSRIRQTIPHEKGWMSPTDIANSLRELGVRYSLTKGLKRHDLKPGINRIQFEGPWLNPGRPAMVAYHHTHWVTYRRGHVLDTVLSANEWIPFNRWEAAILRYSKEKPGTGWHVTHWYEFAHPQTQNRPSDEPS